MMEQLSQDVKTRLENWLTSDAFDGETKAELQGLIDAKSWKEITNRFYKEMAFGTGGLRGVVGAGSAYMNIYNIRKATTAFCYYLKKAFPNENLKVAISYDSRNFSKEFAQASAEICAYRGVEAYITKELRPVPMLSYMVRHFKCHGGFCITASHNPPEYNGFKVYWNYGGQIVPPHDKNIIETYNSLNDYSEFKFMPFEQGLKENKIHYVGEEFDQKYFEQVKSLSFGGKTADLKVVYTPLHGTGAYPVETCLRQIGFEDVSVVTSQKEPDGNFPTVKSPNPEDPSALKIALEQADETNADLVMATDPDSDRIGIGVRDQSGKMWLPNGNQIACLLTDYVLRRSKEHDKLKGAYTIKTIVTTELVRKISLHYGVEVLETLTGFKWICGLSESLSHSDPDKVYLCGGEESYGFLMGNFVRDKDGVSACAIAAEMVSFYKSLGKTLDQVLDEIYLQHGYFVEKLVSVTKKGQEGAQEISSMMEAWRSCPPTEIAGIKVNMLLDYQKQKSFKREKSEFIQGDTLDLPVSNVLQFKLEDNSLISVRPSGTEPKIKFYFSIQQTCSDAGSLKQSKLACKEKLAKIESSFVNS